MFSHRPFLPTASWSTCLPCYNRTRVRYPASRVPGAITPSRHARWRGTRPPQLSSSRTSGWPLARRGQQEPCAVHGRKAPTVHAGRAGEGQANEESERVALALREASRATTGRVRAVRAAGRRHSSSNIVLASPSLSLSAREGRRRRPREIIRPGYGGTARDVFPTLVVVAGTGRCSDKPRFLFSV
jgi:hypothetical protein